MSQELQEAQLVSQVTSAWSADAVPKPRRHISLNQANAAVGAGQQKRVKETKYAINGKSRERIARVLMEGVCPKNRKCPRQCNAKFTIEEVGKVCDTPLCCFRFTLFCV